MKRFLILLGLLASFGGALAAGQAAPNGRGGAVTPTRNILTFTKLENAWLEAVQRRDADALGRMLADNFEIRSAAAPGVPTARADAVRELLRAPVSRSSIDQMAVHEYGDLMVVSFLWTIADGAAPQSYFVVDTWKRSGDEWKAAVRYAGPVADGAAVVPGAVAPSAQSLHKKI
jgi:ketosteroid isomerase-like protein